MTEPVAGYTEAEGYAASLRQQARLIAEGSIELDAEELEAAANFIERLTRCDAETNELAEWKQAASVEAGLRREFLARAERQKIVLDWIESWVSNPVGAYSVSALDGLFGMTRDKIAALSLDPGTVAVASAQYRCTCGAEPYCAPNVHAASCPLAVTSADGNTP